MTIDKEKLVELLVEKTSMSETEIKSQLDQLIDRIIDAAKRGKALAIKEFGVFYFDEEGELRFDPSEELSTEISFKYAGMKPIQLKSERDTSFSDDEPDMEEEPVFTAEESSEMDDEPEIPEERRDPVEDEEDPDLEPPFALDEEDEEVEDETETDPFILDTSEPFEEKEDSEKSETKPSTSQGIPSVSRKPVRKKDNSGIFILIAIVVLAVLIGSYLYYVGTQSQNSSLTTETPTTQTNPELNGNNTTNSTTEAGTPDSQVEPGESDLSGDGIDENGDTGEQLSSNNTTNEENDSNTTLSASETNQSLYGLTGSVIEEANNGYSIVIHSFRSEENANETAEQLRDDGFRVIVLTRTVTGNQVWRVSVGQFETLADAQQATTRLPEPYNTQNFIQRIRIN